VPRLSCIIPVVGNAHGLESTLVSVLEHFPDDCEIIVVHSAPYDDPYDLKSELRFIEAPRRTGYVGCVNFGIQVSQSPIVHLLAAGLEATEGWAEAALARFADPRVVAVAPVVCNQFDSEQILAAGMYYHRGGRVEIRTELPADTLPLDATLADRGTTVAGAFPLARAAFYRRSALNSFGGLLPTSVGNELAAVELGLSLVHAGYRTVVEPDCKVLGSAKSCRASHGFAYGLASERLFWRNLPSARSLTAIATHPFSMARELCGSLASGAAILQLFGRIAAYATLGDCRARHEQLRAAAAARSRTGGSTDIGLPSQIRIDAAHATTRASRPSDVRASRS